MAHASREASLATRKGLGFLCNLAPIILINTLKYSNSSLIFRDNRTLVPGRAFFSQRRERKKCPSDPTDLAHHAFEKSDKAVLLCGSLKKGDVVYTSDGAVGAIQRCCRMNGEGEHAASMAVREARASPRRQTANEER